MVGHIGMRAHCRYLTNKIELSVCGGPDTPWEWAIFGKGALIVKYRDILQ